VNEPAIQMHPQDMARRLLQEGDLVHVTSKRGSLLVPVQASPELGLSQAFMAMHWGEEYLSGVSSTGQRLAGVNALTTSANCPSSRQPELKHAAVKILKAELPWTLLAMAWLPTERMLAVREELKRCMALFPFASCVPFGRERSGVLFRAAGHEAPPDEVLAKLEQLLGLDETSLLRYADRNKGQHRCVKLVRGGEQARLEAFLLAGDIRAQGWIKTLLQDELPAQAYGRLLLSPVAQAPGAVQDALKARGQQVCTCFNVSEVAIGEHLARCSGSFESQLASLQKTLQCGTNCGSCVPQLQRMISVRASPCQFPDLGT
jgi:assimilatory nitrate reductase catalytic subunit